MMTLSPLKKKILGAALLLILAAGSMFLAFKLSNPDITKNKNSGSKTPNEVQTVSPMKDPVVDTDLGSEEDVQEEPEVEEPKVEEPTTTETDTQTTDTGSQSEDKGTLDDTGTTNEIPLSQILGQITPPAEGSSKKIAFTFDDGPYEPVTRAIADEFAKYGGKCTFFIVGNRIGNKSYDNGVVSYASGLGHEIAIHGYTHTVFYNKCNQDSYLYEVQTTASLIESVTGKAPALLRPPGGNITNNRVAESPYSIILWNVDTKDYAYSRRTQANINQIVKNIVSATTAGDIILMHDLYQNSLEAIKIVLPALAEQGYEFVTVSELLGEEMQAGKKYNKAY